MKKLVLSLSTLGLVYSSLLANDVQSLLQKNNCMNCHNIVGMKSAPPFMAIARMNSSWFGSNNSKRNIMKSIKEGSQGKYPMFSNTAMPSYAHLSDKDLNILAEWITSQSSRGMRGNMMNHNCMDNCMHNNGMNNNWMNNN
ncbi:hypothetical protein AN286_10600 (plasmid) [Aliarcobacter cryaerophilus ATCC 43158]|uniref:Cytochrome c n=1 Tax=Aliarcobacter cryaerophilus ATCC 43158 TaxID=1032070 RepID=A0AAD0TUE4_9BACT|nr:c-type cytochrome [Aliarcobacter cryaerophilus]AYJ81152.1 putative cytochrome c [Aliarcobacter cryaerophilus ATCC 43158]PRM95229.1 hypothetical protein CJ667_08860 [Aliarcobacter cryaerophilus]QCZ24906.1 hypothetical protein AN286_10600 [Aliarcobacter cryaerophilus ATCC 43158]